MEPLALVTVDRGDRNELLNHCLFQAGRMGQYDHIKIIRAPKSEKPDLTERIKEAFDKNKNSYEWFVIIESDDFYPSNYIATFVPYMEDYDFIGSDKTIYYNLRNRTWEETHHPNHSSLFCTAFRVSAMDKFKWHQAHPVFLDLDIWRHARKFRRRFIDNDAIGIKHGMGLCGGKGHVQCYENKDPDLSWLQSRVDPESFEFYNNLKLS